MESNTPFTDDCEHDWTGVTTIHGLCRLCGKEAVWIPPHLCILAAVLIFALVLAAKL